MTTPHEQGRIAHQCGRIADDNPYAGPGKVHDPVNKRWPHDKRAAAEWAQGFAAEFERQRDGRRGR